MYEFLENISWKEGKFSQFNPKILPNSFDVYIIHVNREINRFSGIDPLGILYIGKSNSIRTRLNKFRICALIPGKRGHIAGIRYNNVSMCKHLSLENIYFRYHSTNDDAEAKKIEADILREYISFHCEQPPLNYAASYF